MERLLSHYNNDLNLTDIYDTQSVDIFENLENQLLSNINQYGADISDEAFYISQNLNTVTISHSFDELTNNETTNNISDLLDQNLPFGFTTRISSEFLPDEINHNSIISLSSDDYSADNSTSGSVSIGGSTTGEIEEINDQDWFAITLQDDYTYQFDCIGGTLPDPYLHLRNSSGTQIRVDDNNGDGDNPRIVYTAESSGTYYLDVAADHPGVGTYTGTYTISARRWEDDYSADSSTSGFVNIGSSITGEIESDWSTSLSPNSGDQDWFAINLIEGVTYQFDQIGNTLSDPYLHIRNPSGTQIRADDNSGDGNNSRIVYTAESTDTYFINASAANNPSTGKHYTGTYTITTSSLSDDFSADTSTSGSVSVGGSTTGVIESTRDRDWFAVSLQNNYTYQFDLEGAPTSQGTLSDTILRLRDSSGSLIRLDDDGGTGYNSQISYMADSSGTYYLEAASFGDLYTGTYKVSATQTATPPTDDFSADTSTSGSVSVGGSTTGELETAVDKDWFKITLETNVTYKFDLEGSPTGQGTLNDPYIKIYDITGREVASNDNSGTGSNAQLTYKAVDGGTSSGIYYIEASSGNSGTGTYKLSAKKYGYNLIDGHGRASAESAFEQLLGEEIPDVNNLGGNLWGLDRIGAPEVWSRSTGDNITVAVIDTGVDLDHSEFAGRIVQGWDFVDDDNLAEDEGYFGGHGTHVAGTIAGANDGVGITGVAYNADIMPIRVLDGNNGGYGTLEDIAAGVYYAVDNGADIINLSLGSSSPMPGAEAVIQYAEENGVVVVMAAGNDGNSRPGYPARYADDFGIAVGATNYYDNFVYNWSGSSSGSDRAGEPELQYVTAPGESIYSAYAGGSYATLSGTSMAAPHVSGIAALLLGYDNSLSASRIEELIITSASNRTDSVGNSSIDNFTGQPLDGFTSNSTALWEV